MFALLFFGCGKIINPVVEKEKLENSVSYLIAESNCKTHPSQYSAIYNDVMNFSKEMRQKRRTFLGNFFQENTYNFSVPLIVNPSILKKMMLQLSIDDKLNIISIADLAKLEEFATRYEGMKCQFDNLMNKKKNDLRPYLNLLHRNDFSQENLTKMCEAFDDRETCGKKIQISQKKNQLDVLIDHYQAKVENEILNPLFLLRPNHNQFNCQKNSEGIEMQIDVINGGWSSEVFKMLIDSIERNWSKNGLKLKLVETANANLRTLKIIPITNGISHVNDEDLHSIYLSNEIDIETQLRVVAHEFGHILGFPDCYIEFYDDEKNELVYYELSDKNLNIMCTLRSGFNVPESYVDQLKQKTCVF